MVAMYFVGAGSLMALAFAACMFVRVRREPGGNPEGTRRCSVYPEPYKRAPMRI